MAFTAFRGMHPFAKFIFTLFVMAVSAFIILFFSYVFAIPVIGFSKVVKFSSPTGWNSDEAINFIKYIQVMESIAMFIIPAFILAYFFHGEMIKHLMIKRPSSYNSLLYVVLMILLLIPVINLLGDINSHMHFPEFLKGLEDWMRTKEEEAKIITERFLKVKSMPGLLFNIFMVGILPAVGEELLFRGLVQRIFINWTKSQHWGIWIAAILFSAIHVQFYGFLPRMLLGAIFGYLLVWTGSIWVPMLAHFINNTMSVIGYYLMDKAILSKDIEQWGTSSEQLPLLLFSIVSAGGMLYLIYRGSDKTKMPANQVDSQPPRID